MLSILSKIDWKKIMKEENVPYTDEIFETLDNVEVFIEDLEHYSNTEGLKEAGEDIKNETKNLWNKAKGLVE